MQKNVRSFESADNILITIVDLKPEVLNTLEVLTSYIGLLFTLGSS